MTTRAALSSSFPLTVISALPASLAPAAFVAVVVRVVVVAVVVVMAISIVVHGRLLLGASEPTNEMASAAQSFADGPSTRSRSVSFAP